MPSVVMDTTIPKLVVDKVRIAEKSNNKRSLGFQSQQAIPPSHILPDFTVDTQVIVESLSEGRWSLLAEHHPAIQKL